MCLQESLLTRQRALRTLCDYLKDPEHIVDSVHEGMIPTLLRLLQDQDFFVREKATECFTVFASHSIGRQRMCEDSAMTGLFRLANDPDELVRFNLYMAVKLLAEFPVGAHAVWEGGFIPLLVNKLTKEASEIQIILLDILCDVMKFDTEHVLAADSMKVFTSLLLDEWESVRSRAAKAILALSLTTKGKHKAVEEKCMDSLVANLMDKDPDVRAFSAGAIMSIAITTRGKYTAIGSDAILPLVEMMNDEYSEARANALKALTCLAEAPEGRKALSQPKTIRAIREHLKDPTPGVAKAAETCVETIDWKP